MTDGLQRYTPDAVMMPGQSEWTIMQQMASQLLPTGFLPQHIKTEAQAVAIILKGRELRIPPMQALSNISIINGKPVVSAELMLALIYRDHGKQSMRIKESSNQRCVVEYRLEGWPGTNEYAFTFEDATTAGLTKHGRDGALTNWHKYPAAMLRARCISAVARMAFPESISGMYSPGEMGESVEVDEDGVIHSVSGFVVEQQPMSITEGADRDLENTGHIDPRDVREVKADTELSDAKSQLWKTANGKFGWSVETLNDVGQFILGAAVGDMAPAGLHDLNVRILELPEDAWKAIADGSDVASVLTATQESL